MTFLELKFFNIPTQTRRAPTSLFLYKNISVLVRKYTNSDVT